MTLHVLFTGLVSKEHVSGGDQLFLDIVQYLPREIKVVVITPEFAKTHWREVHRDGLEFRFLPSNRFDFNHHPLFIFMAYLARSWQVYKILQKEKNLDWVYSCSDVAYADIFPVFFLKYTRRQFRWLTRIYHVLLAPRYRQGNFIINIFAFYLQRLSFWMMKKKGDIILALNPKLKEELLRIGFKDNKLDVLGAGINYQEIKAVMPPIKYSYDAVVLGRLAPVKGIFDMVKIWKEVHKHNPHWRLAWIGGSSDNYQEKLIKEIEKAGLQESFVLLGYLGKKEIYNILKSAKVFLCPDHENGWGLAICEAMSAGLPVVSYNLDIFGNVYKKGFISVPLYDTASFAKAIVRVLEERKLREKLSREADAQAAEFDFRSVNTALMKFLNFSNNQVSQKKG